MGRLNGSDEELRFILASIRAALESATMGEQEALQPFALAQDATQAHEQPFAIAQDGRALCSRREGAEAKGLGIGLLDEDRGRQGARPRTLYIGGLIPTGWLTLEISSRK